METKAFIEVLEVLRFGLANTYSLPTPTEFNSLPMAEQLDVYVKLFAYVHKNLSALTSIVDLYRLVNSRD